MSKIRSCKIGTVPKTVIFKHKYKLEVGKKIQIRHNEDGAKYFQVVITKINSDGYFFADLL